MHLLGFSEKESVFGLSKLSIFVTIHVVFIIPSRVPWRCAKCIRRWLVNIVQQYLPRLVCQIGWRQLQSSVCEVSGFRGRVNFNWNVQNYKGVISKSDDQSRSLISDLTSEALELHMYIFSFQNIFKYSGPKTVQNRNNHRCYCLKFYLQQNRLEH